MAEVVSRRDRGADFLSLADEFYKYVQMESGTALGSVGVGYGECEEVADIIGLDLPNQDKDNDNYEVAMKYCLDLLYDLPKFLRHHWKMYRGQ